MITGLYNKIERLLAEVDEELCDIYINIPIGCEWPNDDIDNVHPLIKDLLNYYTNDNSHVKMFNVTIFTLRPRDYEPSKQGARRYVFDVMNKHNIYRDDDSKQLTATWNKLRDDIAEILYASKVKPKITFKCVHKVR